MRLLLCALTAATLVACASSELTARQAVDELTAAGLDAPNPRDVTDDACGTIGCLEAVETDILTIYRWADSSQAAAHSQDLKQPAYKLNELVLAFPVDTEVDTSAYANALTEVVQEDDR